MNLLALVTDDITEILIKIMHFTQRRQKVLTRNIREMGKPGFEPRDLAVEEFSESLNTAIGEYALHRLAADPRVATAEPPRSLERCWFNANTPQELQSLRAG